MDPAVARKRWAMLALIFATRVGLGFQFQTMGSVADPIAQRLHLSFAEVGTLIGLFLMPGLVLAIPAGFAGRYAADRVLVALGLVCLALGGALAAIADGFALLALGRLLCGVGFVLSTLYFAKMVVDWFSGRELATAMAILVMSWPFGIAMGQVGHGWLEAAHGWRAPFVVASLYCLVGAITVPGYTPVILVLLTSFTSTMLALGIMGGYVWRTFENTKGRPPYLPMTHDLFGQDGQ